MPTPRRILVVDDTPANLSLLLDALTDAGHEILVAESGRSALSLLAHTTPDLILLDFVMPGLDGVATCEKIKLLPACRDVPILFMTALDEPAQKLRAFEAGALDYITKPVYPPEVLARVAAHLRIRALQQTLETKNAELASEIELRVEAENQLSLSLDRAVLVVAPDGRIPFSTRLATGLLFKYFPAWTHGSLPAELGAAAARPGTTDLALAAGTLIVRRFVEPGRDDFTILHLEEKNPAATPAVLMRLGLTAREAEVLYWLAQGKSNPDIATILALSVRTVHKHVEHIFQKLGLETRSAAALAAAPLLRS